MIDRFYSWLYTKLYQANNRNMIAKEPMTIGSLGGPRVSRAHFGNNPTRFALYDASGGWVLEYQYYDEKKDENYTSLHIISENDDIGAAISRAITFEALRK